MMGSLLLKRAVLVLAVLALPSWAAAAEGQVERGRTVFNAVGCYACHGYAGQGGVGPRLAPPPWSDEASEQFVRGTMGAMPAYSDKVLSDADLKAIFAYLHSLPKAKSPDEIPLLKQFEIKN